MRTSEQINELAAALSKAQGEIEGASKARDNTYFKSKYADLASVWDACREPLAKNGLAIIQMPRTDGNVVTIETRLVHASGQWVEDAVTAVAKDEGPQAIGSVVTYLRRYSLQSIVGVAPEDDDGNAATNPDAPAKRQERGNGRSKAEKVAADTGLTTGDKVQPPVNSFATCETALNARVKDVDTAAKYFAFVKEQKIGHHLTAEQYADLDARGVAKLIDLCDTEADFTAAEKIVRGLHGELRILPEEFGGVAARLADAKEAKLGATV
jgi:hypothetical protein